MSCGSAEDGVNFSESDSLELPSIFNSPSMVGGLEFAEKDLIKNEVYGGYLLVRPSENGEDVEEIRKLTLELIEDGIRVKSVVGNIGQHKRFLHYLRLMGSKKAKDLSDWIRIYVEGDEAVSLFEYLQENNYKVSVNTKSFPMGLSGVSNLEMFQGYLGDIDIGVDAIWGEEIFGEGVQIFDGEATSGILVHDDLPTIESSNLCPPASCDPDIAHATAVAGVLASKPNGIGTTGISHGSTINLHKAAAVVLEELMMKTGGMHPSFVANPGDIYLIEAGIVGKKTGTYTGKDYYCGPTPIEGYGCLPYEADPEMNSAIINAIEFGMTVVEAAGNGTVNLDNSNIYRPEQVAIGEVDDIGSILVGASMGSGSNVKASYSNAGNRVDAFSWGFDVATTGYQYGDYQWAMSPWMTPASPFPTPIDNTNYYINNFGGTSSAAAIIAGAVGLVQSYAKNEIGVVGDEDNRATRYILASKIKEMMFEESGESQQVGGYTTPKKCNHPEMGFTYPSGENPIDCKTLGANWNCEVGKRTNLNPIACGVDPDVADDFECRIYGGFESINAKCVDGKCGAAFCAPSCDASYSCDSIVGASGWLPFWTGSRCVCRPPFKSAISEATNIGRQPNLYQAKLKVDNLVLQTKSMFPELYGAGKLTVERLGELRDIGVGLVCGEADPISHEVVGANDPACPLFTEEDFWPSGMGMAKKLDFDGDGRADLVSWTKGEFKIDLSSRGEGGDNFGEWDLTIKYTPSEGVELPYVADMDSDTREDLVIYNKTTGAWYIKLMRFYLLDEEVAYIGTDDWDKVVTTGVGSACKDTRKMDYRNSDYGRPFIGIFDGDGNDRNYVDLAIACSNGMFKIDYGTGNLNDFGAVDFEYPYILEEHLLEAPGWAYYPVISYNGVGSVHARSYFVPIGLNDAGRFVTLTPAGRVSGGNIVPNTRIFPIAGGYYNDQAYEDISFLYGEGDWLAITYQGPSSVEPDYSFNSKNCNPVVGDFDGDGLDDRALQCPDKWIIVYSKNDEKSRTLQESVREVNLGFDINTLTLPGKPVYGGTDYNTAIDLMERYKNDTGKAPPVMIDMVRMVLN